MKRFSRIFPVLLGLVFFVAGFLKLMDPVGAGLKMGEYYSFYHLGFLSFSAGFTAVSAALAETVLGVALVCGVWPRICVFVSGGLLAAFTLSGLIMLIAKPSMDCGCFGEAVHFTHGESFIKDIFLDLLWLGFFMTSRNGWNEPARVKYVSFGISSLSVLLFAVHSLFSVPAIDFTDFAPGSDLYVEGDDAVAGDLQTLDLPVLSFYDVDGEYSDSLATTGNAVVVSVYNSDRLRVKDGESLLSFFDGLPDGVTPLLLVAGSKDEMEGPVWSSRLLPYVYFADRKTLLTLNRSNGGATLIMDGEIVAKWPSGKLPSVTKLSSLVDSSPTEAMADFNTPVRLRLQAFLLYVFAVMLLI